MSYHVRQKSDRRRPLIIHAPTTTHIFKPKHFHGGHCSMSAQATLELIQHVVVPRMTTGWQKRSFCNATSRMPLQCSCTARTRPQETLTHVPPHRTSIGMRRRRLAVAETPVWICWDTLYPPAGLARCAARQAWRLFDPCATGGWSGTQDARELQRAQHHEHSSLHSQQRCCLAPL